ncbi:extracellular solute-binding protein [Paenibacillus sp. GCM10027628]|uniref:extracellular solute-binding protein n=1 Tax=Paenibacillus sp. GCM10027628 TaxID=3273413 RepID=UPI003624E65A
MSKRYSRMYGLLAATMLLVSACSSKTDVASTSSPADATKAPVASAAANKTPNTSEKVELNWYLLGPEDKDTSKIVAEWNKMLEKDLNTTVKLNFTTWDKWDQKYNLLLTSGEKIDMIFASTWANYYKYAKQGAFLDLTNLIETNMPQTWSTVPKQDWEDVKVKGKIYAIPSTFPEYTPNGWLYREDWRKKLNLPEVKDLASIEAYLDGVKKGMPGVTPINGNAYNEINSLFRTTNDYQAIGGDGASVVVAKSYQTPRDIIAYPFTPEYTEWVKKMKDWADKGYWSKSTLASKAEAGDFIKTGQGAVYWRNPAGAGGFFNDPVIKSANIELGYLPFTRFHNYAVPNLSINNGMAIPKSSTHPERSLMVLDKLRNDPAYFDLMTYGIKGLHYDLDSDGKHLIIPAKGQDPKNENIKIQIASWGWRYEPNMKSVAGAWPGEELLKKEFKAESKPNIFDPITLDYEPVKAEQAAVNTVIEQYGKPLMMGLVKDVDASIKDYQAKLKAAGIDKLTEYVKKEANAYFDEKGIK